MLRARIGAAAAAFVVAACLAPAAQAAGCSYTWNGGSGAWDIASNWTPNGVPGTGSQSANLATSVCITASGTYTVTLAPFSSGSVDYSGGVQIGSLTLGGGVSGTQTLEIQGQAAVDRNNETSNFVNLDLASGASSIASSGELILDGTTQGTGNNGPDGGGAGLSEETGVTLVNDGSILSQSDTSSLPAGNQWQNYLTGPSIDNGGAIEVQSGTLGLPSPNNGGYGNSNQISLFNSGTLTVDSGASFNLYPGAVFSNNGSFVNNGSAQVNGGSTWNQGPVNGMSGNLVQVEGGGQVDDGASLAMPQTVTAGNGGFQYVVGGGYLAGTIPVGQTVDVQGTTWNNSGNIAQATTLTLGGPSNTYPGAVVNNGTLRIDSDGSGKTSGGGAILTGNELDNNGTFASTVEDASYENQLQSTFVNESSGTAQITGGTLYQGATASTNNGIVSIGSGATWIVQSGSFTNNGTFAPSIAGPLSYGTLTLQGGLYGPGTFNAGGTIAPALQSGYVPASGTEFAVVPISGGSFKGTFGAVGGGFVADYGKQTASSPYVGVAYGSLPSTTTTTTTTTTTPTTTTPTTTTPTAPAAGQLALRGLRGGVGRGTVELACPAATSGCPAFVATASVTEKLRGGKVIGVAARAGKPRKPKVTTKVVVVATAAGVVAAGGSGSYTLALNAAGKALLRTHERLTARVTVAEGKTVVATRTVTFTAAPSKHKSKGKHNSKGKHKRKG